MVRTSERKEAWFRIIVAIISGIILNLWTYVAYVTIFINWLVALFAGKRNKDIAEFNELWASNLYLFLRYMGGVTNQRPFPFGKLKSLGKFEK